MDKKITKEMRASVIRAFKAAMKSMEQEPELVIVSGSTEGIQEDTIKEISDWLFHRRDNDGS